MTASTPPGLRRALVLALALALLAVTAAPAFAHGAGGEDASNYRSVIDGVVGDDGRDLDGPEGVAWEVLANDALLRVTNSSGREMVVAGYEGEPYLRIGPDGVFRNRSSPATYLNEERYGLVDVPAEATPDAAPSWEQVSSEPTWYWHDHRIHWMAATDPPQVKEDPGREREVLSWEVPFTLDGEDLALAGTLHYVPPPPSWPWLLGAAALCTGVLALAARGRSGTVRRQALTRAASALVGGVAAMVTLRTLDDVLTVPGTAAEHAVALGTAAAVVLPALAAGWWGLRPRRSAPLLVFAAGLVMVIGTLPGASAVLASSQVATSLPVPVARAAAALSVAALIPVAVAGWVLRSGDREPADDRPRRVQARAVASALVLAMAAACGGSETAEPAPVAAASDRCDAVEIVPVQGGAHLIGDREPPVPYNSTPPTSGWHTSGAFTIDVRGPADALTEPEQVSVLEVGGVVVTYQGLPDGDRATLEETATRAYAGRVAVTPYEALGPGEVAFTAWGVKQRCDGLDLDALAGFVTTYGAEDPGVPGEH